MGSQMFKDTLYGDADTGSAAVREIQLRRPSPAGAVRESVAALPRHADEATLFQPLHGSYLTFFSPLDDTIQRVILQLCAFLCNHRVHFVGRALTLQAGADFFRWNPLSMLPQNR